jgi:hypothetical protein
MFGSTFSGHTLSISLIIDNNWLGVHWKFFVNMVVPLIFTLICVRQFLMVLGVRLGHLQLKKFQ